MTLRRWLCTSLLLLASPAACAARQPAQTSRPGWTPIHHSAEGAAPGYEGTSAALAVRHPTQAAPGETIVAHAEAIAAGKERPLRWDCSGFVMGAYARAGHPITIPDRYTKTRGSEAAMLYAWARADGLAFRSDPQPGDVVFFRDTYGPVDGDITHVALVERVDADGTVTLINYLGSKVQRSKMNLSHPSDPSVNAYFRKRIHAGDPLLSGQLFVSYARFVG